MNMSSEDKPNLFQNFFKSGNREEKAMPKKFEGASKAEELDVRFAENFVAKGGKFIYCQNEEELIGYIKSLKEQNKWNHVFSWDFHLKRQLAQLGFEQDGGDFFMDESDAAISSNFALLADEGAIMLTPDQATNRRLTTFPPNHIILASRDSLVSNLEASIEAFKEEYFDKLPSLIDLDKENKICKANLSRLLNAQGSAEVYVFYLDDSNFGK